MSRHARTEPISDERRLIVPVTGWCSSRVAVLSNGLPRLAIDYGGAELVLDVTDPRDTEAFAFHLGRSALTFADRCRHLMDGDTDD